MLYNLFCVFNSILVHVLYKRIKSDCLFTFKTLLCLNVLISILISYILVAWLVLLLINHMFLIKYILHPLSGFIPHIHVKHLCIMYMYMYMYISVTLFLFYLLDMGLHPKDYGFSGVCMYTCPFYLYMYMYMYVHMAFYIIHVHV